jgi:hypothetical protein
MSTAGYSSTPLPRKLGIREGHRVLLVSGPDGFRDGTLVPLPLPVEVATTLRGTRPFDVIVCFVTHLRDLEERLTTLIPRLTPAGGLWLAWPKKTSGMETDLGDAVVRAAGLATGLVDNKVCAIDGTWSGLRFVVRLRDRPRRRSDGRTNRA